VGVGKGVGVGVGRGVDVGTGVAVGMGVGRGVDVGSGVDVPQLTTNRSPIPNNKRLILFISLAPPEANCCALFDQVTRHLHLSTNIILQKQVIYNRQNRDRTLTRQGAQGVI